MFNSKKTWIIDVRGSETMLQVKHIKKEYHTGELIQKALDDVSLNLRDQEFVAILGPSGSGKTTLLNILGGLDRYDDGDVIINNISTKKYKDKDWDSYRNHTIGFIFQGYNLISHQTVLSNVELALTISGISKQERRMRALAALEAVGLKGQEHKLPSQMSGGQQQRVAIARALVNNPSIILADEPTGALDSETSIQVMDLLKEVAKDRLVVMVTHNPELAKDYASRIVTLKDGKIVSDTNPFEVEEKTDAKHMYMGKSSMSWWTSIQLSFNNLKTKKARTFLTAFAGSIGIIGIALILSLSTGVNTYIQTIEEQTLASYPLQIQSTGVDFTSMMVDMTSGMESQSNEGEVEIVSMISNIFSKIGANDLASLKQHIQQDSQLESNLQALEYQYAVTPQIYLESDAGIYQVHPDSSFSNLGLGAGASQNQMISSMMSTNVFFPMPKNQSLYENTYDLKAGHFPENEQQCLLVLSQNGKMSDFLLYTLGLRQQSELHEMVNQFTHNTQVDVPTYDSTYRYEDLLGKTFKVVNASDYYTYDEKYNVYVDKKNDNAYMKDLVKNGAPLEIVGIVQPKKDASSQVLKPGIAYPYSLTLKTMEQSSESEIVKKQLSQPELNVFTGEPFGTSKENQLKLNDLFTIDANKLKQAFNFDMSKITIPQVNIDFVQLLKEIDFSNTNTLLEKMSENIQNDFAQYLVENQLTDPNQMQEYALNYLKQEKTQVMLKKELENLFNQQDLMVQFQHLLDNQKHHMASAIAKEIPKALRIDAGKIESAISLNMTEDQLTQLLMSFMTKDMETYENNLKELNYADSNHPSMISLYPKDFESKQEILNYLDAYNASMDEQKQVSYVDYVGTLMSSVTNIINTISYVLVAFVAISLVVSSIMIGVITYISVLERKKEIGILRALGASKRNIGQVFNAETLIIGLLAGLIGIGSTLLLLIPGNYLIHYISNNYAINAKLPIAGALILIILSVFLTLIGGILPSKKAAKEDPVKALRQE